MDGLLAHVDPVSHSTSDHETISGLVHLSSAQRRYPSTRLPKLTPENTEVFRQALIATTPVLSSEDPTPQLLDSAASSGIAALSANPPRPACAPCKDYWNQECSDQRRRYVNARNSGDPDLISKAHRNFRKTVKRTK
ncbi:hypothetical protein K3495_g12939 [Podosphaera aphanis]|nr:hypothetical protein K3495_g12939 [Podosphaera aphanis]